MFRVSKLLLELGSGVVNMEVHLICFMKVSPHCNFALTFLPPKDEFAPSTLTSSPLPPKLVRPQIFDSITWHIVTFYHFLSYLTSVDSDLQTVYESFSDSLFLFTLQEIPSHFPYLAPKAPTLLSTLQVELSPSTTL